MATGGEGKETHRPHQQISKSANQQIPQACPTIVDRQLLSQPDPCAGTPGVFRVLVSESKLIPQLEFRFNGGAWQTGNNQFSYTQGGSYVVEIRGNIDRSLCEHSLTISLPGNWGPSSPSIGPVGTNPATYCGNTGGRLTVSATGGLPPYSYRLNGGAWQSSPVFENLSAGTYTVTVRNADGGCSQSAAAPVLRQAAPVIAGVQTTQPADCANQVGSIAIQASGQPSADLEYSVNGGASWSTGSTFPDLPPGSYAAAVRYKGQSCRIDYGTVTLNPAPGAAPTIQQATAPRLLFCENEGSITVTVAGGQPPYQYRLDNGPWQSGNVLTGAAPGWHTVRARSAGSGCESTQQVLVPKQTAPTLSAVTTTAASACGASDGQIAITAQSNDYAGFSPKALEYSITGGAAWNASGSFSGLSAGTYAVAVRYAGEACRVDEPNAIVGGPGAPAIDAVLVAPGGCDGAPARIEVVAAGGAALYYRLDGGAWQSSPVFTPPPGTYTVQAATSPSAAAGCRATYGPVQAPAADGPRIEAVTAGAPAACDPGQPDGTITIAASAPGGDALQYSIDGGQNYQSAGQFAGLAPGTYTVTVALAGGGCPQSYGPVTLPDPVPAIGVVAAQPPASCGASDGAIRIAASGPAPLSYSVDGGATYGPDSTITGLAAGTYAVAVRAAGGCTAARSVELAPAADCRSIWLEAECGEAGAQWARQPEAGASNGAYLAAPAAESLRETPATADDLLTYAFTLEQADTIRFFGRARSSGPAGDSYWAQVDEGPWFVWENINTERYGQWAWAQLSTTTPQGASAPAAFYLTAGPHRLRLSWREAGVDLDKLLVTAGRQAPEGLGEAAEPCSSESGGGIAGEDRTVCPLEETILGHPDNADDTEHCYKWLPETGLDYPYWPNPAAKPKVTTVYTLYKTTVDSLIAVDSVRVEVRDVAVTITPEFSDICPGGTAVLEASLNRGIPQYYLWSTGDTTSSIVVSPARTTVYTVETVDIETGCKLMGEAQVTILRPPSVQLISTSDEICDEAPPGLRENTGIEFRDTEPCETRAFLYAGTGLSGYSYQWSNGETEPLITARQPGYYTVTVTKDGGCSTVLSYELGSCAKVDIQPVRIQTGQGEQPALDAGAGFTSYQWQDGSTGQSLSVSGPGTYAVTVVNDEGCMASDTFTIEEFNIDPGDVFLVLSTVDGDNYKQNIFVCSTPLPEEGKREKIGMEIANGVGKIRINDQILEQVIHWTCAPRHSEQYPIDTANAKLFPMVVKDLNEGYGIRRVEKYWDSEINGFKSYEFLLNMNSMLYELNFENEKRNFPVNFTKGMTAEAELSYKGVSGEYVSATTMSIIFRPLETNENPSYILYYNGSAAPPEITVEEKTSMIIQIKERKPGGTVTEVDLSGITDVTWKKNGKYLTNNAYKILNPDVYGGKAILIQYIAPGYSSEELQFTIGATVSYKHNLSVTIILQPKTITPGYKTIGPPENLMACEKGGDPKAYLEEAKKRVAKENRAMYDALVQNRMVEIDLTTKENVKSKKYDVQGLASYGYADFQLITSDRITIDSDMVIYDANKKYSSCPIDAKLLLITTGEENAVIYRAIDNDIIYDMEAQDVKDLVAKISSAYPLLGSELVRLCSAIGNEKGDAKAKLDYYILNTQLKYFADNTELEKLIMLPNYATIRLGIESFCDITNYAIPGAGFSSVYSSTGPMKTWYNELTAADQKIHEARIRQFTRILAHEMAHVYYKLENKINACKWDLIRHFFNLNDCYPARNKSDEKYCSVIDGHEYFNPDGLAACFEESKYPIPIINK